jgi:16S rRNA (cytidine1402-2'-O)-methyltransferase
VLPCPSAVTTAAAASGLAGGGFAFCGFLPRTPTAIAALLDRLDGAGLAIVAFESPRRLPATLRALADRDPGRHAAVCRELTKLHEDVRRGTLAELAAQYAAPPKGEVTLVLAPAAPGGRAEPADEALRELAEVVGSRRAAALASRLTGHSRNRLYAAITRARR